MFWFSKLFTPVKPEVRFPDSSCINFCLKCLTQYKLRVPVQRRIIQLLLMWERRLIMFDDKSSRVLQTRCVYIFLLESGLGTYNRDLFMSPRRYQSTYNQSDAFDYSLKDDILKSPNTIRILS